MLTTSERDVLVSHATGRVQAIWNRTAASAQPYSPAEIATRMVWSRMIRAKLPSATSCSTPQTWPKMIERIISKSRCYLRRPYHSVGHLSPEHPYRTQTFFYRTHTRSTDSLNSKRDATRGQKRRFN